MAIGNGAIGQAHEGLALVVARFSTAARYGQGRSTYVLVGCTGLSCGVVPLTVHSTSQEKHPDGKPMSVIDYS